MQADVSAGDCSHHVFGKLQLVVEADAAKVLNPQDLFAAAGQPQGIDRKDLRPERKDHQVALDAGIGHVGVVVQHVAVRAVGQPHSPLFPTVGVGALDEPLVLIETDDGLREERPAVAVAADGKTPKGDVAHGLARALF